MKRHFFLVLATTAIVGCEGSPVQPVALELEELPGLRAGAGDLTSDPLYLEVTAMLSHPAVLYVGPDGRASLSPDDRILLAAIELMESSIDRGVQG